MLNLYYSEPYSHFVGCTKGTRCDHGMICGQPRDCKSCSFEECMNHAKNRSSFGFSYRGSAGGFCRLCNETQFKMARVTSNWGLYMKGLQFTICSQFFVIYVIFILMK